MFERLYVAKAIKTKVGLNREAFLSNLGSILSFCFSHLSLNSLHLK